MSISQNLRRGVVLPHILKRINRHVPMFAKLFYYFKLFFIFVFFCVWDGNGWLESVYCL